MLSRHCTAVGQIKTDPVCTGIIPQIQSRDCSICNLHIMRVDQSFKPTLFKLFLGTLPDYSHVLPLVYIFATQHIPNKNHKSSE